MPSFDNCQHCFQPIGGKTICPYCGFDHAKIRPYGGVLPAFTILNGRYLLGRVLGKGGFGVTYIAKDLSSNRTCAIKEYMPSEYSSRSGSSKHITPHSDAKSQFVFNHGREKFVEEARTLITLRQNPIVVDIWDFFQENNTAYLVMECLDGQDLRQMAKAKGGKLDADFAKNVFVTVASSLMEIHKLNILHRDLSPENIIVTKDGKIKLIDFGAARNFVSTQNAGMSILLKPGFAPPEQYERKGAQGPWSDVYALCATFYTLVSGKPLVDALFRYRGEVQPSLASLGCDVTKKTSDVIDKGMELDHKKRYQDFMALLNDIDIIVSERPIPAAAPVQPRPVQPQPVQPQPVQPRPVQPQPVQPQPVQPRPAQPQPVQPQPVQPRPVQPQPVQPQPVQPRPVQPQPVQPRPIQQPVHQVPIAQGQPSVMTTQKHAYIAAFMRNGLFNRVTLPKGAPFTIGRSEQSHYRIAGDTNVSRMHCYVRYDGMNLYIADKSANGTFFEDGRRLEKDKEYRIASGTKFYTATPNHMLVVGIE